MAEDKDEGEVQRTSRGSSVEEGHFSSGLDGQISTIEDQLKRAEATLFDLQSLKGKLEVERQSNLHRVKEEQELKQSLKIKIENERLRNELKEYHSEIGSLKDIISSLKDDLVRTAEKLENKVNKTLNSLEEQAEPTKPVKRTHEREEHRKVHHTIAQEKERNFFNDHLSPLPQPEKTIPAPAEMEREEESAEKDAAEPKLEMPVIVTQTETPAEPAPAPASPPSTEQQIVKEAEANEQAPASEPAADEPRPAPLEAEVLTPAVDSAHVGEEKSAGPTSMAETILNDTSQAQEMKAAVVTQLEKGSQEVADNNLTDSDLDEYTEIKRELEALENEAMFKPSHQEASLDLPSQRIAEPPREIERAQTVPQPSGIKVSSLVSKIFHKKEKADSPAFTPPQVQAPVVGEKDIPLALVADKPAEASVESAPAQPVSTQPPVSQNPEPAQEAPAEVSAPAFTPSAVEGSSGQAGPEDKKHISVANIFKNKKRKIKGQIDDGRDIGGEKKSAGGGKLVIAAAVVLFLAIGIGVFFKIKNAESLKQMYIAKATENVAIASTNINESEVPDEFTNLDPEKKYKEAYAELPFAETAWAPYTDNELGITIEYPKNSSYRLKPVGSNNIWFLRRNGYLLKIEKLTGQGSLGQIRDSITANVKYKSEEAIVRGNSTIHLTLEDDLPVKGNIYLTGVNGSIYKIWYKTFLAGEDPDDEQRVKKMLDTLDFIPNR